MTDEPAPVHQLVGRAVRVVDEQDTTTRRQTLLDHRPEPGEPFARHMREPETEEHRVVPPIGTPAEQVVPKEPDPVEVAGDPVASQRQHLRGGIHRSDRPGTPQQQRGPRPRPARKLEHVTGRRELGHRPLDLGDTREIEHPVEIPDAPAR